MGKEQVTLRELRKDFYKIRKFEIQNLWQRSIFLATFTVLLFTGYGTFAEKLFSYDESKAVIAHFFCCLLAFIGSTFAIIWIMMAKGSKAWFEIYERRIMDIEKEDSLGIPTKYLMREGAPFSIRNSLWLPNPGAYSVSKINIILGQVLLSIWLFIYIIHTLLLISISNPMQDRPSLKTLASVFSIILFCALYPLSQGLKKLAKSKGIITPEEEEKRKEEEEEEKRKEERIAFVKRFAPPEGSKKSTKSSTIITPSEKEKEEQKKENDNEQPEDLYHFATKLFNWLRSKLQRKSTKSEEKGHEKKEQQDRDTCKQKENNQLAPSVRPNTNDPTDQDTSQN